MKIKLRYQLPRLYSKLLAPEILDFNLDETKATCSDCAMTREKRGPKARVIYRKDLKCCTFEPMLPNYLAGTILREGNSFLLDKKIPSSDNIPLAVLPTVQYRNQFAARKPSDFGQKEELLCGYYDREKQNCSIWKSRGSVCTTFFCMSDFGDRGMRFWRLLGEYLHHLEMCLAEEALVHLDFSPRQVSEQLEIMTPRKRVTSVTEKQSQKLWNGYEQKEFYIKAAEWVEKLTREQMPEILGEIGLMKEAKVIQQIKRIESWRQNVLA